MQRLPLAMREARASGRLAYATLALWPWRSGATWAARSVLVHPADVAQAAARAADEMHKGAAWAQPDLAHNSLNLLEMRLRDLTAAGGTASNGATTGRPNIIVHSPTLLETTSVFAPSEAREPQPTLPMGSRCSDGSAITPTLATGTRA